MTTETPEVDGPMPPRVYFGYFLDGKRRGYVVTRTTVEEVALCDTHQGADKLLEAYRTSPPMPTSERAADDLPGMWEASDLFGGWADTSEQRAGND